MTVAELDRWVLEARWGEPRQRRLREYLERFAVFPYNRDLCAKWAEVTVAAHASGRRIDCADAWIAATALLCRAPLITHNRNDYVGVARADCDLTRALTTGRWRRPCINLSTSFRRSHYAQRAIVSPAAQSARRVPRPPVPAHAVHAVHAVPLYLFSARPPPDLPCHAFLPRDL